MRKRFRTSAVGWVGSLAMLVSAMSAADEETGLADAITGGDADLSFRYRYEFVDEEGFDDNANASTLRTRLNFETKPWRGWSGLLELDHVLEVLVKDFNSGAGTSGAARDGYPALFARALATADGPPLRAARRMYRGWRGVSATTAR